MKNIISVVLISFLLLIACNHNQVTKQPVSEQTNSGFKDTLEQINRYLLKQDAERIKSYTKRKNRNMQITETGLWYEIYEKGNGEKTKKGQIVEIKYRIELLDGTLCYTSDSSGTKQFKLGHGGVERGLEEALLLMHKGDKAHFIMPPYMAHGLQGDFKKIPARSVIVYQVELINIFNLQ